MLQVQTSIFLDVPERLGKFIVAPSFTAHIINIRINFQQGACMVRLMIFFVFRCRNGTNSVLLGTSPALSDVSSICPILQYAC